MNLEPFPGVLSTLTFPNGEPIHSPVGEGQSTAKLRAVEKIVDNVQNIVPRYK